MSNLVLRLKKGGNVARQVLIMDWFFCLFLLVSFFNVRKVLFFHSIGSNFNEYQGGYLYLADLVFISGSLLGGLFILYNKNKKTSIKDRTGSQSIISKKRLNNGIIHYLLCLPKAIWFFLLVGTKKHKKNPNFSLLLFFFGFVGWSFFSLLWAVDFSVALYRSIRLLELVILASYVAHKIVPRGTIVSDSGFKNVPRETFLNLGVKKELNLIEIFLRGAMLGLLFVALFDHYLWDIWIGQLLFWLLVGFLWGFRVLFYRANSRDHNIENVPRGTLFGATNILMMCLLVIIFVGSFNSLVAIIQFITQKSLGLRFLGESIVGTDISGVAKLVIGKNIILRSYGLLPHPNVLGGLLLVSIILTILSLRMAKNDSCDSEGIKKSIKLFHVEQLRKFIFSIRLFAGSCFSNLVSFVFEFSGKKRDREKIKNVPRETLESDEECQKQIKSSFFLDNGQKWYFFLLFGLLLVQIVALFLTFSKSAIGGIFFALAYIYFDSMTVSGEFFSGFMKKMFHVEHFWHSIFVFSGIVGFFCVMAVFLAKYVLFSVEERLVGFSFATDLIFNHSLFGVGIGQFVPEMLHQSDLLIWQYQPVHNLFLLVWSELGVVGLVLFLLILGKILFVNR